MTNITIENGLPSIGSSAFQDCIALKNISFPSSIVTIDGNAFLGCLALEKVTLNDGLIIINDSSFSGCNNLKSIEIPETVSIIHENAFENCTLLNTIILTTGLTDIRDNAFRGCTSLTSVFIPSTVTSFSTSAFSGCTGLTSYEVDSNNPYYMSANGVLYNKNKETILRYPINKKGVYLILEGVTRIEAYAFGGCTGLTNVHIPDSVTRIGDGAFSGCSNLTKAYFYGKKPSFYSWDSIFSGHATSFFAYYIPVNSGYSSDLPSYLLPFTPAAPAAPIALTAKGMGVDSVEINWNTVTVADGYVIYYSTSSTGSYSLLTTTTGTHFVHGNLVAGNSYYYKARAYRKDGNFTRYGIYSVVVSAKPIPSTPIVVATKASSTSIKVGWNSVAGATQYEVYRASTSAGAYALIACPVTNTFTNTGLKTATTYYYKVRAYKTIGTTKVYGNYSTVVSAKT